MKRWVLLFTVVSLFGCRNKYTGIPNVNVNLYINLQDPQYQSLSGLGSWAYLNGGSKGIIIFNLDNENYLAYERHCPYDPENSCAKIVVDDTDLFAEDTCCTTKYQLIDGQAISGPGGLPLKAYNTSFDGNIIRVWN